MRTICLIEDNSAMRDLLVNRVLRQDRVIEFCALTPAIKWLQENTVDQIILDLNLPDSRGADTYRTLRAALPHADILVLTGVTGDTIDALHEEVQVLYKGSADWVRLLLEMRGRANALAYAMGA